jgi:hypothetical protein
MARQGRAMTETITIVEALEREVVKLASAEVAEYQASEALQAAEGPWDEVWDATAAALRDELREAGLKREPSEHAILSAARRADPKAYREFRAAKYMLDRARRVASRRSELISAFQTMAKHLGAEADVQDYLSQRDEVAA